MASSLIMGRFDLLDLSSPATLPPGWLRSFPNPTTTEIQSAVLDGAIVGGRAAGNRQPEIPIVIRGSRAARIAVQNEIQRLVNLPSWELRFQPDGGFPVIWDCFRATVEPTSDLLQEAGAAGTTAFTVRCSAKPYGRSASDQTIALGGGSAVVIDSFETAPTVTAGQGVSASTSFLYVDGAKSASFVPGWVGFTAARSGLNVALTAGGLTTITLFAQQSWNFPGPSYPANGGVWTLTITLGSGAGATTYTATSTGPVPYERWAAVQFNFATPVPQGTVTAWSLQVPKFRCTSTTGNSEYLALDFMYGAANNNSTKVSSPRGAVLTVPNVLGTARTNVALALARSDGAAFSSWVVHTPPSGTPNAQCLLPLTGQSGASYTTSAKVRYGGTYKIYAVVTSTVITNVFLTFSQSIGAATIKVPIPGINGNGLQILDCGEISLPLTDYPFDASATTTVTISGGASYATVLDVLLLDTRGGTTFIDDSAPAAVGAWLDRPLPGSMFGGAYSGASRSAAQNIGGLARVLGAVTMEAGSGDILVYSPTGALNATATYSPMWQQDAEL